MPISRIACLAFTALALSVAACGGDGDTGGASPSGTNAGQGGAMPLAGAPSAGSTAMSGGASGSGGASLGGSGGAAGATVAGGGGQSGAAGTGGIAGSGGGMAGAGGMAGTGGMAGAGGGAAVPFVLTSPSIERHDDCTRDNKAPCAIIDSKNTLQTIGGQNQSPELDWGPGPDGTMSYAVALHDLSNGQNGYTHWVVWNLPATTLQLPANLPHKAMLDAPPGAQQASFNNDNAYAGPGAHGNVYEFKVYALKVAKLDVADAGAEGAIRQQLEQGTNVLGSSALRAKSP